MIVPWVEQEHTSTHTQHIIRAQHDVHTRCLPRRLADQQLLCQHSYPLEVHNVRQARCLILALAHGCLHVYMCKGLDETDSDKGGTNLPLVYCVQQKQAIGSINPCISFSHAML